MTNFLTVEDVRLLHDQQAPEAGLIDVAKLDSALNRPIQSDQYESDATLHNLAAVLCEGICQAHAFEDGNKRTALVATVTFYALNGYVFDAPEGEIVHLIVDLTTHDIDAPKAAERFSLWAMPRSDADV